VDEKNVNVFRNELICLEVKLQFIYIVKNLSSFINIKLIYIIYVFSVVVLFYCVRRSLESWELFIVWKRTMGFLKQFLIFFCTHIGSKKEN